MYPLIQCYFYTLYCKLRTFWRPSPITPLQIRTVCLLPYQPIYTLKIKIPRDCTLQSSCFRGTLPNLPLPSECSRPAQLHIWTLTIWVCGLQWWIWQIMITSSSKLLIHIQCKQLQYTHIVWWCVHPSCTTPLVTIYQVTMVTYTLLPIL